MTVSLTAVNEGAISCLVSLPEILNLTKELAFYVVHLEFQRIKPL
jgi:hypothetical protein